MVSRRCSSSSRSLPGSCWVAFCARCVSFRLYWSFHFWGLYLFRAFGVFWRVWSWAVERTTPIRNPRDKDSLLLKHGSSVIRNGERGSARSGPSSLDALGVDALAFGDVGRSISLIWGRSTSFILPYSLPFNGVHQKPRTVC